LSESRVWFGRRPSTVERRQPLFDSGAGELSPAAGTGPQQADLGAVMGLLDEGRHDLARGTGTA
jgi:hypothetical protein